MRAITKDTKRRMYCGPTSLCAVTGLPASTVLAWIEANRGEAGFRSDGSRKGVRGMWNHEVLSFLRSHGYPRARYIPEDRNLTLAAWLREDHHRAGPVIVSMAHHYTAVDARTCIDTTTKGAPVSLSKGPNRRARVKGWFVFN